MTKVVMLTREGVGISTPRRGIPTNTFPSRIKKAIHQNDEWPFPDHKK